ncbi:hypothetical protein QR680_003521 [Steinernema hermaphroditum]|uniref:Uncharacterized protein n=1 Tax=Steinernema hermaphroditum TaxID=289476 RepID=A0AA39HMW8_9BILA|nr:hypothetical protein QR680_003521 [Steinernema hermaphroditum]
MRLFHFILLTFVIVLYSLNVNAALSGFTERAVRVKRQYCLNYPCPPGSTPDVPNWGYYNYHHDRRYYNTRYYAARGYRG